MLVLIFSSELIFCGSTCKIGKYHARPVMSGVPDCIIMMALNFLFFFSSPSFAPGNPGAIEPQHFA